MNRFSFYPSNLYNAESRKHRSYNAKFWGLPEKQRFVSISCIGIKEAFENRQGPSWQIVFFELPPTDRNRQSTDQFAKIHTYFFWKRDFDCT